VEPYCPTPVAQLCSLTPVLQPHCNFIFLFTVSLKSYSRTAARLPDCKTAFHAFVATSSFLDVANSVLVSPLTTATVSLWRKHRSAVQLASALQSSEVNGAASLTSANDKREVNVVLNSCDVCIGRSVQLDSVLQSTWVSGAVSYFLVRDTALLRTKERWPAVLKFRGQRFFSSPASAEGPPFGRQHRPQHYHHPLLHCCGPCARTSTGTTPSLAKW